MAADQVTFQATLQDNVSPNLEKLEKQLQAMGQSPIQIKMILDAVDNSSSKIKQAQQALDRLPKKHIIHIDVQGGVDKLREELRKTKEEFTKPFRIPFELMDKDGQGLDGAMSKMFRIREKIAMPLMGSLPGSSMLYGVGMGAGIAGAITGLSGLMQQSFQANSELEQAHQKLTIALRDNSGATTELNKVISAAQKSPYTFQQTLQADVLGQSYQAPVWPGQNRQVPQGYLQIAGNMAAAMGSQPDDAMMALAMARQHQFRRMQMYGVRMTAQDFGAGGQYAGMSVDQALELATKRFSGAMGAQMHTFSGMVGNIKDVIGEQIMRPVGQNVFQAVESKTGNIQQALNSPGVEKGIGKAVEQVQHLTVQIMQDLTKIHQYFDVHLKTPLEELIHTIKQVGQEFGQAFGGTTATVIKTFADAVISIVGPISSITKAVPQLTQLMGMMKAMQFMGLGGSVKPLQTMTNAINPFSSQGFFSGMVKGVAGLPGMALKLGGFFAVKELLDAHRATADLNDQFKNMKGHMDNINSRIGVMALKLGESDSHMKNLVTYAAQGIPTGRMDPKSRANLALNMGQAGQQIGNIAHWSGVNVIQALQQQMKTSNDYSIGALHKFGGELIDVSAVAHQLGMSFSNVMQVLQTFSQQAGQVGLGGLAGAPSILSMSKAINNFGVTPNQQEQGHYTPDAVLQSMLTSYAQPTIDDLRVIGAGHLGNYWNFKNAPAAVGRYGQNAAAYGRQAAAGQAAQTSAFGQIGQLAPSALQGQYAVPSVPNVWQQAHLGVNFQQFAQGSPLQNAQKVMEAWGKTADHFQKALDKTSAWNATIDATNNKLTQLNQAQATVNLQMQAFQHRIQSLQRPLEDAQLALSEYTLKNLAPLEVQLNAVQNSMDKVNHSMQDAQFYMSKFSDGLLMGEQAALNQLHALSLYNEQLNYLKMQYTQIGAQLGTRVYTRGFSARVGPLMGLSLEEQMQQLQRKQQMEQSKYDITYGEGHYQMQQAQRSLFQRTEMPLNQRLAGIRSAQSVIDRATVQNKVLQDQQFTIQQKMYGVNVEITKQQNHITGLQNAVTAMNQSSTMRHFEDEQYNLGQAIGLTNEKLTKQQLVLSQWENTRDNLNQMKQDLQNLFDTMIAFNSSGGGIEEMKKIVHAAGQTGVLPGGHYGNPGGGQMVPGPHGRRWIGGARQWVPGQEEKGFITALDQTAKTISQAQKDHKYWYHEQGAVFKTIRDAVWGIFTGETLRSLAGVAKKIPFVGGAASEALNIGANIAPIASVVVAGILASATATWGIRKLISGILSHTPVRSILDTPLALGAGSQHLWASATHDKATVARIASEAEKNSTKTLRDKLAPTLRETLKEEFKVFRHPLHIIRSAALRGGGAAVGYAFGGIPGAFGGQFLGGYLDKRLPHLFQKSTSALEKSAETAKKTADKNRLTADEQKKTINKHGKVIDESRRVESGFKNHVMSFKDHVVSMGQHLKREEGSIQLFASKEHGVGKFSAAIGILAAAATLFSSATGGMVNWIKHLIGLGSSPHPHTPNVSVGRDVAVSVKNSARARIAAARDRYAGRPRPGVLESGTSGEASRLTRLARSNPAVQHILEKTSGTTSRLVQIGGKVFTVAGRAFNALSVEPAAAALMKGKIGKAAAQAAEAGEYFIPGLGYGQMLGNAILGTMNMLPKMTKAQRQSQQVLGNIPGINMSSLALAGPGVGNMYATQAVNLEGQLKSGKLTKSQYDTDLKELQKARQNALQTVTEFDNLEIQQRNKYWGLSASQQKQAQENALKGPNGMQQFLSTMGTAVGDHYNARLGASADYWTKEGQNTYSGFQSVGKTTSSWLTSLTKQIKQWERSNGLHISTGQAAQSSLVDAAGNAPQAMAATEIATGRLNQGMEHGGVVQADPHQHRLGHGKLVKMVEEGHPELVIPLAPHRRNRAKGLLKQAHQLLGMAAGGYVFPYGPGITSGRIDQGWDMGGSGKIAAIGNTGPLMQGPSGWPGTGQGFYYQLQDGPRAGQYVYDYENIQRLKPLGYRAKAGEILANLLPGFPHLEAGWATSSGDPTAHGRYTEGVPQPEGYDFQRFLEGLAHGKLVGGGGGMGATIANISPIHLKGLPRELLQHGAVGLGQHKILANYIKYWQHKLNSQASKQGGNYNVNTQGLSGNFKNIVRQIAKRMNWDGSQVQDWFNVIQAESGGDPHSTNPTSGAYGIAQMLASGGSPTNLGPNKQKYYSYGGNPNTIAGQLVGMANYIKQTYKNPASAWAHELSNHWYAGGKRRVPYDNFPAMLHQDERVLSAAESVSNDTVRGGRGGLKNDTGWQDYYITFLKTHKIIGDLQYDIHHIKKYVEDALHKKNTGHEDTTALAALNAALRAARGKQVATGKGYYGALAHHLRAIHDPSSGEATAAGVLHEKEVYKTTLKRIETHDPILQRDIKELHKDQSKLSRDLDRRAKLLRELHSKNHKEAQKAREELKKVNLEIKKDRERIHRDEMKVHQRIGHDQKEAFLKYLQGAAHRGVNAALIKAITGHALNPKQMAAYKAIENTSKHGHEATKREVNHLAELLGIHLPKIHNRIATSSDLGEKSRALIASRADATRSAVRDHIAVVQKHHKDAEIHRSRQVDHMNKTEAHHRRLEDKLDKLVAKDLNVNISATGATVTANGADVKVHTR